ncbi:hypothetical protein [Achromobacter piechaudii]|uniref:Uncharacterized protein n=1 Tax=Achromobacter piechaudii ATCC 43553 TaxID=742159 RepID=D4XEK4_9BURK|nr:hypothetical protein [Achromobacter piechaudii]EFF74745.1 hypothetical protein HMPREF0004_3901 [Achromobacter piechaudii ATCC 43553]
MLTATLTPALADASGAAAAESDIQIPLHTLRGDARVWADRLLSVFSGKQIDGVEWSMKFSAAGLVGNRFMLGVQREHWRQLDVATLSQALAIPQPLWMRVLQDMEHARAMFFAYEPDDGAGTYRIYLEFMPTPEALRQHGVLPLGCGYKWHPATQREAAITAYRMRYLADRAAFDAHLAPRLAQLANPVLRQVAERIVAQACEQADPAGFMFLEVDEADTRRDSFTVTFRGADLPLRAFIPDLLRLAASMALAESEVLGFLLPDEPRSLYSLAAGAARDGHEFLTVYYD